MKAYYLFSAVSLFWVVASYAETRAWSDQKTKKTIQAELVKVDGDQIVIRVANGKEYTLPISRFSDVDQTYVREQASKLKPGQSGTVSKDGKASAEIRRAIRLTAKESSSSESSRSEDESEKTSTKTSTKTTKYFLTLTVARGAPELEEVNIDYVVYKRSRFTDTKKKSEGTSKIVPTKGKFSVENLPPGSTQLFTTTAVSSINKTQEYKEKKKKYEKRTRESVMGVIVKVTVGGAEALVFEHPGNLGRVVEKIDE